MDNVTHSLVGYALGRAFAGALQPGKQSAPEQRFGRALVATAVIASNAPDLDFLGSYFERERQLLYLLEHRGLTHTAISATLLGGLIGWLCMLVMGVRGTRRKLGACALGVLACTLHIGFDFLNDYGVHPFYPVDNHWYYGDSVFIVEPLLLSVLLPLPLFFALSRTGRTLTALLALALLALTWLAGVSQLVSLAVTVFLVASCLWQRRLGPHAGYALIGSALIVVMFATGARLVKAQLRAVVQAAAPREHILDLVTSPAPANPRCFRALIVSLDPQGVYRARLATAAAWGAAESCALLPAAPTAPLTAADLTSSHAVHMEKVFSAPAAELVQLARTQCDAEVMLRFIRVPFWTRQERALLLGDLRYDRAPAVEFAERLLNGVCNTQRLSASPWEPPRGDLLAAPAATSAK